MGAQALEKISKLFEDYFAHWHITLPPESLACRSQGEIHQEDGWQIQYLFGRDARGEYLDFYARHRMTNDRHLRIYEDGTQVALPAEWGWFAYHPKVPGDEERARRERDEHDQRVRDELRRKGFR
jgi:hypothetical protein